jgi:hypothetical protein
MCFLIFFFKIFSYLDVPKVLIVLLYIIFFSCSSIHSSSLPSRTWRVAARKSRTLVQNNRVLRRRCDNRCDCGCRRDIDHPELRAVSNVDELQLGQKRSVECAEDRAVGNIQRENACNPVGRGASKKKKEKMSAPS